jgi:arylsulfatase A-like enzyme
VKRWTLLALLLLSFLTPGCRKGAEQTVDLIPLVAHGDLRVERSQIPLDPVDVPEFGEGWTRSRLPSRGSHFRWASDDVSTLDLVVLEPRDLELQLKMRPFTWPGSPAQGVTIDLNGHELGSWEFDGPTTLRVPLPAEDLRPGDNKVGFSWVWAQRVSEVLNRKGQHRRAAAITNVIVAGLSDPDPVSDRPPAEAGLELLPASQMKIALWADEKSRLEIDSGLESEGGLQVWVRRESEDLSLRWTSQGRGDSARLPLGNKEGPVEIVFRTPPSPIEATRIIRRAQVVWPSEAPQQALTPMEAGSQPDILLYVVDTLRADRLSCYGGPPGISPALDGLAADGVLFENVVAQSSWTKPSMVSVLSGLLTTEHDVRLREPRIPSEVTLVAEHLQSAGYRTAAITTNAYLVEGAGFARGFEGFEYTRESSEVVTQKGLDWLDEVGNEDPVFLWIHTIDPHAPYDPSEPFRSEWAPNIAEGVGTIDHIRSLAKQQFRTGHAFREQFLALYDAEVAQNDASLGIALEWLRERGRYQDTLVAFLSDHGEEFWEHGVNGHGHDLFEEVLHVPLVIKPAGRGSPGLRRTEIVEHIDLVPTLLAAAGLDLPAELRGRNLLRLPLVDDENHVAFSEMTYDGREGVSLRWRNYKLIVPVSHGFLPGPRLFDLESDPDEKNPVTDRPVTAAWLALEGRRGMALLSSAPSSEAPVNMDRKIREDLEALGYLDPGDREDE